MSISAGAWSIVEINTTDWQILNVYNSLSRFCIPLFLMLTGALFLSDKKEITIKGLFKDHIIRIVTAFFVWSIVYVLFYYWLYAPAGFSEFTVYGFIDGVLRGDPYKHWFIFLSISLYFLIPILRAIAKNLTVVKYFLVLWVIFSLIFPAIEQIPLIFGNLPTVAQEIINQIINASERIKPLMVLDYVGYFMLGYYIHAKSFSKKSGIRFLIYGLLAFVFTLGMTTYVTMRDGAQTEMFFNNISLNIALFAASVMVVAKVFLGNKWYKDRTYKSIKFFSDGAFGIFLTHDFIRVLLEKVGFGTLTISPILSVPILAIIIFIISGLLVYIIRKIPIVGKYIV